MKTWSGLIAGFCAAMLPTIAAGAPANSISVQSVTANAGDSRVVVQISMTNASQLSLLDAEIRFDPSVLCTDIMNGVCVGMDVNNACAAASDCDASAGGACQPFRSGAHTSAGHTPLEDALCPGRECSNESSIICTSDGDCGIGTCLPYGQLKLDLVDLGGGTVIPAGSGVIAEWVFDVSPTAADVVIPLTLVLNQAKNGPTDNTSLFEVTSGTLTIIGVPTPGHTPTKTTTPTFTNSPTKTPTSANSPSRTPTNTPPCAPTGTPYCSDDCMPCPTIRAGCYASACGACIQNPTCGTDAACIPTHDPSVNGCCVCATFTPTPPAPTNTVTNVPSPTPTRTRTTLATAQPTNTSAPTPTHAAIGTGTATRTPTNTPSQTPTGVATNTFNSSPTAADTPTATPTLTVTNTPGTSLCVGDCDGHGSVTVNEIIILVNVALGTTEPSVCPAGVPSGHTVDIALIIQAVNHALNGCAGS